MRSLHTPHVRTFHRDDGVVVVCPVGEFDMAVLESLRSTFAEVVTPGCHKVVVDLSETTFLDSMALGTIIGAGRRATGWGGWLRLVSPPANIRKVLRVTEVDKVFGLYDTVEQACQHALT